jgi:serine/threonine-protein kinase
VIPVNSLVADALRDRYVIERELGRGGMAIVYQAHDLRHDRSVALKVLHPELAQALGSERFEREIKFAARLQHPHILTLLDSGEAAGQLWFTMPRVEGESLRDRLRRERQLAVDDALRIATEAARALEYAHQHGIIHRDIKPENLLLTTDGTTLVADFGIARALSAGAEQLTGTGLAIGTPAYMSPEQAAGDRGLDVRTDVYALGTVLYEMLVGEPPYTGATAQAMIAKRFSGAVPRVRTVRPSVSEALEQAVTKALALVPADRFASAAEFAQALVSPAVSSPSVAAAVTLTPNRASRPPQVRSRVPVALLVGLGVVALGGLGGVLWQRNSRSDANAGGVTGPKRLAVLPFENLGDTNEAYFAEGIAAEIRGTLANLPTLTVIASTSSNQYRHTAKTPRQIARELGVQYLLVGHVQWEKGVGGKGRVRVTPELVDATDGATKWQQPFDATLTDVFQVQADIAGQVAGALNVALGAGERRFISQQPTANLLAYDAFLKGEAVFVGDVWDPASLRQAIGFYEEAVAHDSTFAPAWAQLARARGRLHFVRTPGSATSAESVRMAAERARTLAPGRPEAQLAWGGYLSLVREDFGGALQAYEAGLQLAPTNAELLLLAATMEYYLGRWEASIGHARRAQALDPRAVGPPSRLAAVLLSFRRWAEARQEADRALALAPTNLDMLEVKIETYVSQGDLAGAQTAVLLASRVVGPTVVVARLASYNLCWLLDSAQQALLLRLTPAAFDNDRGAWGIALAEGYALRGDQARVRIYADSARLGSEEELRGAPENPGAHTTRGVALAYLGRRTEAIREGERGVELNAKDLLNSPYNEHQLARIYLLLGEPEKAIDRLKHLLAIPYSLSPGRLRIDPTFDALRDNPRFERLVTAN